ncbi:MAG: diguanylate cyclase, partial [Chloroflexota bacterium]
MQPESEHHDASHDPALDGRDSLRLVKLRLGLTLIAVAILPIAAVSPLVRAVAEEARVTHHDRLADQASIAASQLIRTIDRIRVAGQAMLDDPAIVAAAKGKSAEAARDAASERLEDLADGRTGSAVDGPLVGATLVSSDGVVAGFGLPLDLKSLPAKLIVSGLVSVRGPGGTQLLVVETSASGDKPTRTIVSAVSIPMLLGATAPDLGMPGRVLRITDPTGAVLAEADGPFDPSALPGEMLDLATMATHDSDGRATIDLPGVEGWQIVVSAPIPFVALPMQAIGALAAMLLLLVVFTMWMARQILRPASQLEASRSRLRELYESAREAALRDSLTGLGNHRAFQEAVARMVEGARRYGTSFSLVLIDIDEFKRINDTRGHAV